MYLHYNGNGPAVWAVPRAWFGVSLPLAYLLTYLLTLACRFTWLSKARGGVLCHSRHPTNNVIAQQLSATSQWPCYVGVKWRHLWIEFLISANERVLVDFPDFTVVVPRRQVIAQVLAVARDAARYLPLNLLYLWIMCNHFVDRLLHGTHHTRNSQHNVL